MQNIVYLILCTGGIVSLLTGKREKFASSAGCISGVAALVLECLLVSGKQGNTPGSVFFFLPIILIGIAAACHAPGYLSGHAGQNTGRYWLFYNLTLAAMLAVFLEENFLRFIVYWELMGLFSLLLVLYESKKSDVVHASWIYLLACELGGLLLLYVYAADQSQHDFSEGLHFGLLAAAFGLKAGFPFLHVWLPEAHPAAPAPVSALMSGAMIPLGFLGLFRFAVVPSWGGWFLLISGMCGAFFGILSGMAQENIKRLLAYSSFENIGIISMGFGLGLLGREYDIPFMAEAGFGGAMLHVLSHSLLKGSLFLGAGSVYHAVHTLDMDRLGGLMKKMPVTGGAFALSSMGISGLPPFAGFTGELMIYTAAFTGITQGNGKLVFVSFAVIIALALTGGCACAAFCKVLAAVFQGEPRSNYADDETDEKRVMSAAVAAPAFLALLIPFAAPFFKGLAQSEALQEILNKYALFAGIIYAMILTALILRKKEQRDKRSVGTWDCGFAKPTARMEYTGTAFVQPTVDFFHGYLNEKKIIKKPEGIFLDHASLTQEREDFAMRVFWKKIFTWIIDAASWVHRFQSGYLHLYILIMILALTAMLVWGIVIAPAGGK